MAWVPSFVEDYKKAHELLVAMAVGCRESIWELLLDRCARLDVDIAFNTINGR